MPHIRNYFLQLTRKIFHVIIIAQLTSYFVHLSVPYVTSFQLQGGTMPSVISRFRWLTRAIIVLPLSILFVLSSTMLALANVALTQISTDPYTNSTSQHKQTRTLWRTRALLSSFGALTLIFATVFGLAFSTLVAYAAAPLQISSDPYTQASCAASATTNHHTEVEPDTYSNGSTIVSTFQVGRVFDGGACAIGFATSSNNGSTWTSGLLPGITKWKIGRAHV